MKRNEISMAKLIILRGNSGSGKTTIAKKLQKNFGHGTLLISQDVVRREMLYVKDGDKPKVEKLLLQIALYEMCIRDRYLQMWEFQLLQY